MSQEDGIDIDLSVVPLLGPRRVTYPLLRVAEWQTLFTQCGFKNVWTTPDEASCCEAQ